MERWFAKYPYKLSEKDAICMIYKEICTAKTLAEEGKDAGLHLKMSQEMIEDFFEAKKSTLPAKSSLA